MGQVCPCHWLQLFQQAHWNSSLQGDFFFFFMIFFIHSVPRPSRPAACRDKLATNDNPGPGHYDVPTTLAGGLCFGFKATRYGVFIAELKAFKSAMNPPTCRAARCRGHQESKLARWLRVGALAALRHSGARCRNQFLQRRFSRMYAAP